MQNQASVELRGTKQEAGQSGAGGRGGGRGRVLDNVLAPGFRGSLGCLRKDS